MKRLFQPRQTESETRGILSAHPSIHNLHRIDDLEGL
jgi:hypothetical protein